MCWSLNHKKPSKFIIMEAVRQEIPGQLDKTIVTAYGRAVSTVFGWRRNSAKIATNGNLTPEVVGGATLLSTVLKLTLLLLIFNLRYR
jgi:hypothetical protein